MEKADVVGTIEAIEDAAQPRAARDKSAWRKSNLNVPNSTEETMESARRLVRQRSRESVSCSGSPLKSIIEEDRRKSIIQQLGERSATDRLQIYIRRPSDSPDSIGESKSPITTQPTIDSSSASVTSDHHSIYIRPSNDTTITTPVIDINQQHTPNVPRRIRRPSSSSSPPTTDDITNNKIEIDSDNIETPPSVRRQLNTEALATATNTTASTSNNKIPITPNPCRKLQTPRPLHKKTIEEISAREIDHRDGSGGGLEPETLGDGQFDRHSSTRRTRRYKRPTDHSSGAEDRNTGSPDLSTENKQMLDNDLDNISFPKVEDKEARLKRWKDRLASLDKDDSVVKQTAAIKTRVGKVGRNISSINQEDVREAIRNLKSPTETPERVWSPPREIIKENNIPTKASQYELNDEGFEETQSLVSDTPSHGKDSTSSCNEQADPTSAPQTKSLLKTSDTVRNRIARSDSATTADSTKRKLALPTSKANVLSLLERNRQSLERSRSLRITASAASTSQPRTNMLPKRTNSLRKNDSASSITKRDVVERSGSRTSLRSSRSSLNSSASTNTVKNVSQKTPRAMTLEKSIYKKPQPLTASAISPPLSASSPIRSRMPASRSSSSGSSISTSIRRSPAAGKSSLSVTNSFKENQSANTTTPSKYGVARTSSLRLSPSNTAASKNSISTINTTAAKIKAKLSSVVPATRTSTTNLPTTQTTNSKIQSVSNFMRPTAASATKFSGAKGK